MDREPTTVAPDAAAERARIEALLGNAAARKRSPRRFVVPLLVVALIAGAVAVWAPWDHNRQTYLADQYTVLTAPSPENVRDLADATEMSDEGRLIFLASVPVIARGAIMDATCPAEIGYVVLGCYFKKQIYIFEVQDDRLAGANEVTAAHEMLHAAYERLDKAERTAVDSAITAFVEQLPADDPTFEVMAEYPDDQQLNEWHSRLGTEYAELSPELERHYSRYFDDRSAVVGLYEHSIALVNDLGEQLDALAAEIDALTPVLTARSATYDAALAQLNADIASFNERSENGGFASQAALREERDALAARSDALEAEHTALDAETDRYNALIDQLTELDADYADLYQSLDNSAPPPPEPDAD